MSTESGRISLRLELDDLQALDGLVDRRGYVSRSEAVRDGIQALLDASAESLNARTVRADLPRALIDRIGLLMDAGVFLDSRDGLVRALERGVAAYEDELLERGDRLERKVREMLERRAASGGGPGAGTA